MPNAFVHIELNTDDVAAAKKFYKSIFKWTIKDMKMGPGMIYSMVDVGDKRTGGGIQKKPMAEAPTQWLPYVEVDDVNKTVARAQKAGGRVVVERQELPGMGALAIFIDPTGAAIGVWETGKKAAAKKPAAKKPAAKKPAANAKRS